MKLGRILFAVLLIAAGVLLLLINLNVVYLPMYSQWPLVLILGGLGMWMGFLDHRREWGLVIPGTILLCIGTLFYCCSVISWRLMATWWPVFILAPGLGMFAAYLFGSRSVGLMIPACILSTIGLVMLLQVHLNNYTLMLPMIFIVAGVAVLLTALLRNPRKKAETVYAEQTVEHTNVKQEEDAQE